MFLGLTCSCGAAFEAEAGDYDTLVLLWANSFISIHRECGFMGEFNAPEVVENTTRYDIKPKEQREKEL